jgi:hypothetical protein
MNGVNHLNHLQTRAQSELSPTATGLLGSLAGITLAASVIFPIMRCQKALAHLGPRQIAFITSPGFLAAGAMAFFGLPPLISSRIKAEHLMNEIASNPESYVGELVESGSEEVIQELLRRSEPLKGLLIQEIIRRYQMIDEYAQAVQQCNIINLNDVTRLFDSYVSLLLKIHAMGSPKTLKPVMEDNSVIIALVSTDSEFSSLKNKLLEVMTDHNLFEMEVKLSERFHQCKSQQKFVKYKRAADLKKILYECPKADGTDSWTADIQKRIDDLTR